MALEDWLQSGKWASGSVPDVSKAAGKALEGLGGLFDKSRRRAEKVEEKGKERLHDVYDRLELADKVDAAKEKAGVVRDKASDTAEKALRFVKEKPAARIARTGVQIKAGLTGFGAGYLFPDVEVLFLGIGSPARWVVQSGAPVWGAERLARALLLERPTGNVSPESTKKWDVRRELYGAVAAPLLTGFSAGRGVRLVQDALTVRGIPDGFKIIIGGRAMIWERVWMLGNGIWCFAMGKDLLMVTLGRGQSQTLSDMLRRLRGQEEDDDAGE